jgi:hypothetical protein
MRGSFSSPCLNADEIWFPQPIALLPVVGRDERLNELLRRYAEEALARKPQERLTDRSRTEDVLSKLLPHGRATISEAGRRLGMSPRTLSRNLAEEGISFAEILDELRAALANAIFVIKSCPLPNRMAAWLSGGQLTDTCVQTVDRYDAPTVPFWSNPIDLRALCPAPS